MGKQGDSTIVLHVGHTPDAETHSCAVPLYQTASYVFESAEHAADLFAIKRPGNIYTRLMNPTTDVLEKRVAALEGGSAAIAASSGMAAIFLAVTNIAKMGDHVISSSSLYGGTDTLFRHTLPRMGIEVEFIDDLTPEKFRKAARASTKLVYAETIGNPKGDVLDIGGIAKAARAQGLPFMIDNTFAASICKPFEHGADIVVHSLTKWIGGHGTSIGGVVVDSGRFDWSSGRFPEFTTPDPSYHGIVYQDSFGNVPGVGNIAFVVKIRLQGMRNMGPCISPFNSFQIMQGLETLPLRMKKHCENALALASHLRNHPLVSWVSYVGLKEHSHHANACRYLKGGFGSVFGFGVKGGYESAKKFIGAVKLSSHLANVGDAKTLVIHPASTTHQQLTPEEQKASGLSPDFIRVSVGIEDIEDIIKNKKIKRNFFFVFSDFDQAMEKAV